MDSERVASIRNHVTDLVEIFLDNMEAEAFVSMESEESYKVASVTTEGMQLLSKKMDDVPYFDRLATYSMFLDELSFTGIPYNQMQFEQVPGSVN